MNSDLTEKKRNNTNQFEENMPNVEHTPLGEEKRNFWKKKFSRLRGIFWSGGTYRRKAEGVDKVTCEIWRSGKRVASAEGFRMGKWTAEGNAKRNALRALKKALGRRFQLTDHKGKSEFEFRYVG